MNNVFLNRAGTVTLNPQHPNIDRRSCSVMYDLGFAFFPIGKRFRASGLRVGAYEMKYPNSNMESPLTSSKKIAVLESRGLLEVLCK